MDTIPERPMSSFSSSGKIDPLLKDLSERKQSFRRNLVSLAAELKDVRTRLALQEQSYVKETQTRQNAEARARGMEDEISRLHETVEEKNKQLQAPTSNAEKFLEELDELRFQLTVTKATADASASSAQSAKMMCLSLVKDVDEKNSSIKRHEECVKTLAEKLDKLQKDLQVWDSSQKQLKEDVIEEAVAKVVAVKDLEMRKVADEISLISFEMMNRLVSEKDEEIAKLRDEIKVLSAQWKQKTKELEAQLENHLKADQEMKKRVLKLEFHLQEARSQTRKLQRMGERRDNAIKELKDELATKQEGEAKMCKKQRFWDTSSFKILVSMSMLVLVVFSRR